MLTHESNALSFASAFVDLFILARLGFTWSGDRFKYAVKELIFNNMNGKNTWLGLKISFIWLFSAYDITVVCIQLHASIYIILVVHTLVYKWIFHYWVILFFPVQGWVPLPTVPHHASGNKKYWTSACVPPECPFQYPQWAGMCYQYQPCKCYPSARQPQWVFSSCFNISHYLCYYFKQ